MASRLISLLILLACAACATGSGGAAEQARPEPVVVGYVPAFRGLDAIVAAADFSPYTHVNLAFVNPGPDGRFVAGDDMACMSGGAGPVGLASFRGAVARIRASGAKVLISLGGGTIPACSGDWAILLRPENRPALVRDLVALADAQHLDGIDIDIEGALLTRIDGEGNYVPFVEELGTALRARGKLLTCATASYEGGMIPIASIPWFDLVNVMAYDAIGPSWGAPGDEHSPYEQAARDLALWRERGVPPERLVLGLPFYGYGFGAYAETYAFRDILAAFGEPAARRDLVGERCPGCSYITYNGLDTLARKARLARQQGAGVMVWEITQDSADGRLIRAVRAALESAARSPSDIDGSGLVSP